MSTIKGRLIYYSGRYDPEDDTCHECKKTITGWREVFTDYTWKSNGDPNWFIFHKECAPEKINVLGKQV